MQHDAIPVSWLLERCTVTRAVRLPMLNGISPNVIIFKITTTRLEKIKNQKNCVKYVVNKIRHIPRQGKVPHK